MGANRGAEGRATGLAGPDRLADRPAGPFSPSGMIFVVELTVGVRAAMSLGGSVAGSVAGLSESGATDSGTSAAGASATGVSATGASGVSATGASTSAGSEATAGSVESASSSTGGFEEAGRVGMALSLPF